MGVSQSDYDRVSCGSQDNGSSLFKDGTWVEWVGADGMEQIIHPLNSDYIIANIQFGSKFKTTDGAVTGNFSNNHASDDMDWLAPCAYNPRNFAFMYSLGEALYASQDFGDTYTTLHNFGAGNDMTQLAIAENNSNTMIAARFDLVYKSTNGGQTFGQIGIGTLPAFYLSDIAFDPLNDSVFALVYSNHEANAQRIMITTDGGTTFSPITYNLSNIPVHSIAFDHLNQYIYVGTETGVYAKTRSGTTWQSFNTNLPSISIREIEIQYGSNQLYAASWGRGLWVNKLINRQTYPVITKVSTEINTVKDLNANAASNHIFFEVANPQNITSAFVKYSVNNINLISQINVSKLNKKSYAFDINAGTLGDSVYFKIIVVGLNNDTTSSYRYMYKLRGNIPYCAADGDGATSDYITNVSVGSANNISNKSAYSDFTSIVFSIPQFSSVPISVALNFAFPLDDAGVWIDWDRSNTFEASEAVAMSPYTSNVSNGTISVPPGASVGNHTMRVRNSYFAAPIPCGNDAGEVEDYTIAVTASCSTNPIVSNTNDRYLGSLRYWMDAACANDTIYFSSTLANDTTFLYSTSLLTTKPITIYGSSSLSRLSGENNLQIFNVQHATNFVNLKMLNGSASTNGGAFKNTAPVSIRNVEFINNKQGSTQKSFTALAPVTVLSGLSTLKK